MSLESHYAGIRAKFFPPTRPIVTYRKPPATLKTAPTEEDVREAGNRAWSHVRREAHRLAILAIYDEGVRFGRVRPWKNGESPAAVDIIRHVCQEHGITIVELRGRGRSRVMVDARRRASLLLRKELGMSFPAIGRALGRDHSSIINLLGRNPHKRRKHTAMREMAV